MEKPLLLVLESVDGLGKTTQCKLLASHYKARLLIQPSANNLLGFLREEVKEGNYDPFSRQLLHTISHIIDYYDFFPASMNTVMDRCHLSTIAYSTVAGVHPDKIALMMDIHKRVISRISHLYDIHIVLLHSKKKFVEGTTDNFEKTFSWDDLNNIYNHLYNGLGTGEFSLFSHTEKCHHVDVFGKSKEEIFETIKSMVGREEI